MPPTYSLGDVLRTTAKTSQYTDAWKAYHDDPERRPLDGHSQCYEENCGFPPKDAKAVTGTPVALDDGDISLVAVAMITTTRRWPYAAACLLFALLTTTLVLSAVTLGRVADDGESSAKDCAAEVIQWRHVVADDGAPPSDAVLLLMDDGTYRAHKNYDGSGVGRTRPCLHLMHTELTKRGQTWPVATGRRILLQTGYRSYVSGGAYIHHTHRGRMDAIVLSTIAAKCPTDTAVHVSLSQACSACNVCDTSKVCTRQDCERLLI